MSTGENVDVAKGMPGKQLSIKQFISVLMAKANEERIKEELESKEPDFFVGPNGRILPKEFKNWTGSSRRDSLLKKAKDKKVKNAVDQLYRPGSFIGDGDTASVIKFEKATKLVLGYQGNSHIQKGREMLHYIDKKILTQSNLSASDRKLAEKLAKDLRRAIWR